MDQLHVFAIKKFEEININTIITKDDDTNLWFTGEDIGLALGLAEPRKSVNNIYDRHREELEEFSSDIKLMSEAGLRETRIYSEEGLYLIAILSQSPKAKAFRKWVINLIKSYRQKFFMPKPAPLLSFQREPELMIEMYDNDKAQTAIRYCLPTVEKVIARDIGKKEPIHVFDFYIVGRDKPITFTVADICHQTKFQRKYTHETGEKLLKISPREFDAAITKLMCEKKED